MQLSDVGRKAALVGMGMALALALAPSASVGGVAAGRPPVSSQILSFDHLPGPEWFQAPCSGGGSSTVDHGFLTLDSPSGACREFILYHPDGVWNEQARNARGWVVEAALSLDPSSPGLCEPNEGVELWMHDDTELVKVGVAADGVCLNYPDYELAPMDTSGLHTYRVEAKGRLLRVYVDGRLVIDHTLTAKGGGTRALDFGDGNGAVDSLSRWDYLRYQTRPGFKAADWAGSAWPAGTRRAPTVRLTR